MNVQTPPFSVTPSHFFPTHRLFLLAQGSSSKLLNLNALFYAGNKIHFYPFLELARIFPPPTRNNRAPILCTMLRRSY